MSDIRIKQNAQYAGESWWDWSVELEGDRDALGKVKYVEYELHPTFPKPIRKIADRGTNFRLETAGWGTFPIHARVVFDDDTEETIEHDLELYYPDGTPTTE
ncbi:MAG: pYEATS domain-containing protein [Thermoanaerobaculia bacterium]